MKIPTPNYTQSPNVLFDEVFKTLKEGELRVVLVLIRQTFGWHKLADRISLSQMAEKTGMERKSVARSLLSLIEKGLVEKFKFGKSGQQRCYYSLALEKDPEEEVNPSDGIETEEEMALFSNKSDQCPKDTPLVSLGHPPSVFRTPTKETHQKKHIQNIREEVATDVSGRPKRPVATKLDFSFESREFLGITEQDKAGWASAYPATEIERELAAMREWLLANPTRRKSNYRLFITRWLSKAQDKGPPRSNSPTNEKPKNEIDILIEMYDPVSRGYSVTKSYGATVLENVEKAYSYRFTDGKALLAWMKEKGWKSKR